MNAGKIERRFRAGEIGKTTVHYKRTQDKSHTGQTGSKGDNGILQYSVQGQTYRIVSIQGSGIYRIGDTAQVRYLPNDPASAREDGQLAFDLLLYKGDSNR